MVTQNDRRINATSLISDTYRRVIFLQQSMRVQFRELRSVYLLKSVGFTIISRFQKIKIKNGWKNLSTSPMRRYMLSLVISLGFNRYLREPHTFKKKYYSHHSY